MIESVQFNGGLHDGMRFEFCERANALIGSPNSGKSLVIDAIKFAFGMSCEISEVEDVSLSRMRKCMPTGTTIELVVRTPEGKRTLTRTVGGTAPSQAAFRPIVFSQTELTRRGMAPTPAIALLDLHADNVVRLKENIRDLATPLTTEFKDLLLTAQKARDLREAINNPQDGLVATRTELNRLVGTEEVARRATDAVRVVQWRQRVREAIDGWNLTTAGEMAALPAPPRFTARNDLDQFIPADELDAIRDRFRSLMQAAVDFTRLEMVTSLDRQETRFVELQRALRDELKAAGFQGGSEVTTRLEELRDRVGALEETQHQLSDLEQDLQQGLVNLRELWEETKSAREALTTERKSACREVNKSMRSFFARVDASGNTQKLDALVDDLKTGTYMRPDTRRRTREDLDRMRLLEQAIRCVSGQASDAQPESDQDRIVAEAVDRKRTDDIARLACLWPGDELSLERKSTPPTPYSELTEGLRALAIKEISFAASDLPVISDQPEDAVPTRSVFDSLVPTLREQRANRQFIVVSHDANIVVASDVEQVCVMGGSTVGGTHTGNLFDPIIRDAALEHLEGGQAAFMLRAARYQQLDQR